MKVAVLEVGHWHAPLARIGLERAGAEVVAVSARDPAAAQPWVERFGARAHRDAAGLLAAERPDFVFVFDRHRDLAATARAVLERGIACSIEKPGGMDAAEVAGLVERRDRRGVFASVPFVNRLGPLVGELRRRALPPPIHAAFVDIAGSPRRYPAMGCDWMLDPALAGGGCLINLGVHFIDLFAFMTGRPARLVGATLSRAVHRGPMEDHARLLLDNDAGGSALVEVGYCHPDDDDRHQAYSVNGRGWLAAAADDVCRLARGTERESFACPLDAAPLYADYVEATLRAAARGGPPVARLEDLLAVMTIVDAAYAAGAAAA
ncbi:MAG: Gfo/Idh/MocA family oxidoreductase [Alphaproteobacteria bacterium]|nr:Gfo/Idh/MocA family oxidoreductase [Alphaproteobacteria bacterium]